MKTSLSSKLGIAIFDNRLLFSEIRKGKFKILADFKFCSKSDKAYLYEFVFDSARKVRKRQFVNQQRIFSIVSTRMIFDDMDKYYIAKSLIRAGYYINSFISHNLAYAYYKILNSSTCKESLMIGISDNKLIEIEKIVINCNRFTPDPLFRNEIRCIDEESVFSEFNFDSLIDLTKESNIFKEISIGSALFADNLFSISSVNQ
ncbi:MAG: hypothetical protein WC963_05380 [Bacilli bacterium]|jgi:hypothetical protein